MAAKKTGTFTAEERALMRERARELKANASKEQSLKEVMAAFSKMGPTEKEIGKKLHALVQKCAPDLWAKTWYSMPAWANADGKTVLFFQDAGKFKVRYSTIGFTEHASLDDGNLWPTSFAILKWTPVIEKQLTSLIKQAVK
jgi:uncharacterized protein YdhG (YjbR/CyaY superfamily)